MTDDPPSRPPDPYQEIMLHNPGSRLTAEEVEFGRAMHEYQTRYRRRYPAWCEVLFVLRLLGYAKVSGAEEETPPPGPLPVPERGCSTREGSGQTASVTDDSWAK